MVSTHGRLRHLGSGNRPGGQERVKAIGAMASNHSDAVSRMAHKGITEMRPIPACSRWPRHLKARTAASDRCRRFGPDAPVTTAMGGEGTFRYPTALVRAMRVTMGVWCMIQDLCNRRQYPTGGAGVWPHFAGWTNDFLKNLSTSALNSAWNAMRSNPGASTQNSGATCVSSGEQGARKAKWPAFAIS